MIDLDNIPETTRRKLQLYVAAFYMFEDGRSHPQIVELLKPYEPDHDKLVKIVDKAMREDWDAIYFESRKLTAEGLTYDEVIAALSAKEEDKEIVKWVCDEWYDLKFTYLVYLREGPDIINKALASAIAFAIFIPVVVWAGLGKVVLFVYMGCFFLSVAGIFVGLKKQHIASRLKHLFEKG